MNALETRWIALPTGVGLNVVVGGAGDPIIFLHGFPESHRTWRHILPDFARDCRVIAPDQRGFGGSDKPEGIDQYRTGLMVGDVIALADALDIGGFTLVGHDWGGAVAWLAALRHPDRVKRLVIVNAPHPFIFQNSLIDDPAQRAASQYINRFREPRMEAVIEAMGPEAFFEKSFSEHVDLAALTAADKQSYLDEWSRPGAMTAMLNWYRASEIVVPQTDEAASRPPWTQLPFPHLEMPALVLWGMRDKALLPVQLEGLEELVDDLRIVRVEDAGHFLPWEKPDALTRAFRAFLAETPLD